MKGMLYFNAYSHFGYMTSADPVLQIVEDEDSPVVHFSKGEYYDENNLLSDAEILDSTDKVTVGIQEEHFNAEVCKVFLLTKEEYKNYLKTKNLEEIDAYKVNKSWIE